MLDRRYLITPYLWEHPLAGFVTCGFIEESRNITSLEDDHILTE